MFFQRLVKEIQVRSRKIKHEHHIRPKTSPASRKEIEEVLRIPKILTRYTVAITQKHMSRQLMSSALLWSLFEISVMLHTC